MAPYYERDASLFEAVISGANAGLRLIAGIVALLLAVLGLVALAPSRTRDIAAVGTRALLAATLACLLTACVAGAGRSNASPWFSAIRG